MTNYYVLFYRKRTKKAAVKPGRKKANHDIHEEAAEQPEPVPPQRTPRTRAAAAREEAEAIAAASARKAARKAAREEAEAVAQAQQHLQAAASRTKRLVLHLHNNILK